MCDLSTGLPSGYCNILLMHSYLNEKAFPNLAALPDYVDGHSLSLRMQSECGKMQEKWGPEKIRIRTLFTQCNFKCNYRIKILNIKLIFFFFAFGSTEILICHLPIKPTDLLKNKNKKEWNLYLFRHFNISTLLILKITRNTSFLGILNDTRSLI